MSGTARAARIGEILIGTVFVIAGLSKIWEPVLFFWEALPYTGFLALQLDTSFRVAQIALLLAPVECGLGLALLLRWRPRPVIVCTALLLGFFTVLTFLAWRGGLGGNCGCFGTLIERGPQEAMVEDVVMLVVLLFAGWGTRALGARTSALSSIVVLGATVLALGIGCLRFFPEAHRIEGTDLQVGIGLGAMEVRGVDVDLGRGDYLLEVFTPRCARCRTSVSRLNQMTDQEDMPQIVALTAYEKDSKAMTDFEASLEPRYAIGTVSIRDFSRLGWRHRFPRFAYVRDGVVQAVWDYPEFPSLDRIRALRRNQS